MSLTIRGPAWIGFAGLLAFAALPQPGAAATLCSVSGASLAFGSFAIIAGLDPAADADRDSMADVSITCSGDPGASVGLEVQLDGGSSGSPLTRRMAGPGTLSYNMYSDSNHSTVWGDGTSGNSRSVTISLPPGNPTGTTTLTAYGRIPRGQRTARIGAYYDNLLVTIVY